MGNLAYALVEFVGKFWSMLVAGIWRIVDGSDGRGGHTFVEIGEAFVIHSRNNYRFSLTVLLRMDSYCCNDPNIVPSLDGRYCQRMHLILGL